MSGASMRQWAPWPDDLEAAVADLRAYAGWRFSLADIDRDFADTDRAEPIAGGLTFVIFVPCQDSYHPDEYRPVVHYHPVPAATYNRDAWERWLFDRIADTMTHEGGEWVRFKCRTCSGTGSDGIARWEGRGEQAVAVPHVCDDCGGKGERRPFAPLHGPGENPYVVHSLATVEQRSTSYRGEMNS